MVRLVEYAPDDRGETEAFLAHPDGLNLYIESRLGSPSEGRCFLYRESGRIEGVAWFGKGRNLVLAGEAPGFASAAAELARQFERSWIMVTGPFGPVSDLLAALFRSSSRRPRLDRSQTFCVQRPEALPALRYPDLMSATADDLAELAAAAARMSAEDFEIDPWRIDREAVRRLTALKIREERSYLCREEGVLAFKADLAVRDPRGGQVEGVYTSEAHRGRGIASRAMAEIGHRLLGPPPLLPILTLHVSSANTPALRAYSNAGYRSVAELRLAIFPS